MDEKLADMLAVIVGHVQLARLQLEQGNSIDDRLRGIEAVATEAYNLLAERCWPGSEAEGE